MDVIGTIFSWLPATSIMSLRLVRRDWRYLHEDATVINRQARNSSSIMRTTSNLLVMGVIFPFVYSKSTELQVMLATVFAVVIIQHF